MCVCVCVCVCLTHTHTHTLFVFVSLIHTYTHTLIPHSLTHYSPLTLTPQVLKAGSCANPVAVVANYLFDTLYHDIFQVENGELKEGLISVGSKAAEEPDPLEPTIIQRLDNHYKYNTIDPAYYKVEDGDEFVLRRVLNWYVLYIYMCVCVCVCVCVSFFC